MHKAWKAGYILPWIGALLGCFWLVHLRIPFDGVRELRVILNGRSPWFDPFLPGQRVTTVGTQPEGWVGQKILGEPVYTSLRLPGIYTKADIGLEFRSQRQPLIEIGVRQEPNEAFTMQPFWSEVLEKGWKRAAWQGRVGYVRAGDEPSALGEKDMDKLLVWYASSTSEERMDTGGEERSFSLALRGAHDIYAVPTDGRLSFSFKLQDMNRQRAKGTVIFSLSKNGDLLWSEALSLAGSRDARPSAVYEKTVNLEGMKSGIYKLSLSADDDIFLREIRSPLRHWVVGPRLYFADQIGYATTTMPGMVWTNARHISAETLHKEGVQEMTFGSSRIKIEAPRIAYQLERAPQEQSMHQPLTAPRGDVRMVGDGYFAFAEDLLFLPSPRRLTDASRPLEEGVRAILTPYVAPTMTSDGWYKSSNNYSIEPRPGRLRLIVGAPGIEERKGQVEVRAVNLTYTRPRASWQDWLETVGREMLAIWRTL